MGYLNPGPVVQVTPNTVALMEQVGTGDVPISGNLLVGTTTDNGARLQVVGSGLTDIADFIMSGGATSLSISSAGNVTVNAPSSGVALTVSGVAGSDIADFHLNQNLPSVINVQNTNTGAAAGAGYTATNGTVVCGLEAVAGGGRAFVGTITNNEFDFYTNSLIRATISNSGNFTISAPTSGVALTVDGFAGSFAGSFVGANATTGIGLLVQGSYTGVGTVGLVQFQDVNNTNGVNILLSGNGATTPNKTIKVSNGAFQITNNAYSVNLINLTDAGALTVLGPIGANNVSPPAQQTGWGTPTGTGVIASFPGATATLAQTSQAVATIIAYMESLGFFGA